MAWGKLCGKVARSSVERLDEELVIPSGLDPEHLVYLKINTLANTKVESLYNPISICEKERLNLS